MNTGKESIMEEEFHSGQEIIDQICGLPKGSIVEKRINNKTYYYHRWSENGIRYDKYVRLDKIETLREGIEKRKQLESILKKISSNKPSGKKGWSESCQNYHLIVKVYDELRDHIWGVENYRKRDCFEDIHRYVYGDVSSRVLILYGLRRTGKTTLIKQLIYEMDEDTFEKTALIQVMPNHSMEQLGADIEKLYRKGFRYVFIDEATKLDNFVESAAFLADIYATSGMKIILSGTDSLGFMFAEDDSLYDRCRIIHTTFIPFREFERVMGTANIDDFIESGGLMSRGDLDGRLFSSEKKLNAYLNTSIAENIQNALSQYQYGGHFRSLQELYDKKELTSVINRVVEDINHRFTIDTLARDFKSNDLGILSNNLINSNRSEDVRYALSSTNKELINTTIRKILDILNEPERTVKLEKEHAREIKEYLALLDLIEEIDIVTLDDDPHHLKKVLITQPGLRYAQADALIAGLLKDEYISKLSRNTRNQILDVALNSIRGRLMEEIVLLETKRAFPKKDVFTLMFPSGEFDMVVSDDESESCRIYEVKHSTEAVDRQYRHLIDREKCEKTERIYGKITEKAVIYRGKTHEDGPVRYINVGEYLRNLGNSTAK